MAWFIAFASFHAVHTPSMADFKLQQDTTEHRVGKRCYQSLWAILSPEHLVPLYFCMIFTSSSYFLLAFMATSSRIQPLVSLILPLKLQCFLKAAASRATHLKALCYSWCFELLSPWHVFSILTPIWLLVLLDFSGVILPMFHLYPSLPSLIFQVSLSLLSASTGLHWWWDSTGIS